MRRKLILILLGALSCAGLCAPALAQDNQNVWPRSSVYTWETVNAEFVGPFSMNRDYSYENTIPETFTETYSHSLDAGASEGRSRIFDVMSVTPTTYGSRLWTSTNLGYDQLETGSHLTASERTAGGR